ncbi:MAG: TadE family protein, partial [Xanthobacteraceae bacterium]
MAAIDRSHAMKRRPNPHEAGVAAVEFAFGAMIFFLLVFGVIEVSRLLFVYNTLQEVTRRAAAGAARVFPSDAVGMAKVRQDAVLRNSPGELLLGFPVSDQHVRIDYLALTRDNTGKLSLSKIDITALPASAAQNRTICMGNPNAAKCVRFVRASICDTANVATCQQVKAKSLVPLVDLPVPLHKATTIATVES